MRRPSKAMFRLGVIFVWNWAAILQFRNVLDAVDVSRPITDATRVQVCEYSRFCQPFEAP